MVTVLQGWGGVMKLTITTEGEANTSFFTWRQQGEVPSKEGKLLIKPSDLVRTHSLSREQHGDNCPYDSITSCWVPPTTCGDYGNYNSGWDLGGDTAKPYQNVIVNKRYGNYGQRGIHYLPPIPTFTLHVSSHPYFEQIRCLFLFLYVLHPI